VGNAHHFLGNQAAAQLHLERGMALAVELGTFNANFFGFDPRIRVLVNLARALWLRGFSDQALRIAQRPLKKRQAEIRPVSICFRWFMPRCCYYGPVICQEPATSSSS
jgi:hypothetical protein